MSSHVCPWWGGYFIDNRLRRWLHDPNKIVGPYVKPGMTVLDVGCGMGMFTIAMANRVGDRGRVLAADLQQEMLDVLQARARKAGVADRIETHRCEPHRIGIETPVDFALAFAMIHETPDAGQFLQQIDLCLKPGGLFFVAEPRVHVPRQAFDRMLAFARGLGWVERERPRVTFCRAVVLAKPQSV